MSAFDRIIGYDAIKSEFIQICDMIHNKEYYDSLGAKLPQGILLYGKPGLGKTLIAKSFIEESGLKAFTIRKNKNDNTFVSHITETFEKARENAPSIVFLDDMDKFANEDDNHRDAEEYVAIQSGIDDSKGFDVFVLATVNNIRKMPDSLMRPGRFDRKFHVMAPTENEAIRIITHFLSDKKIGKSVNITDLTKMISYSSCAELETLINEAAISAAFKRNKAIEMPDLVQAVLREQYDSPDNFTKKSADDLKRTALHEAGHLVVAEVLEPGSVGLASIRSSGRDSTGGFIHRCKEFSKDIAFILVPLAGKAAVELYYSDYLTPGCDHDIDKAVKIIRSNILNESSHGLEMVSPKLAPWDDRYSNYSESFNARNEAVTHAELERCMVITRDILLKNRAFLEKVADALVKKETLLYSDIEKIRKSVKITKVAA